MIFSRISVVFPNFSPQKWRFMQEKTQGVVLRTLKYNDNSLIVDIYTAIRGTVSFMVKLPKSRKAALKGVFFRPLSILEIDFDGMCGSSMFIRRCRTTHVSLPWLCSWPNSFAVC